MTADVAPLVPRDLRVRLRHNSESAVIVSEGHTFPGRFLLLAEDRFSCSVYELDEVTEDAARWLDGYLHGQLPQPPNDDGDLDAEWEAKRRIFLRCGAWPGRDDYRLYPDYAFQQNDEVQLRADASDGALELQALTNRLAVISGLNMRDSQDAVYGYSVWVDELQDTWDLPESDLIATGRRRKDYEDEPEVSCECCDCLTVPVELVGGGLRCPICGWIPGSANLHDARAQYVQSHRSDPALEEASVRTPLPWEFPPPRIVD